MATTTVIIVTGMKAEVVQWTQGCASFVRTGSSTRDAWTLAVTQARSAALGGRRGCGHFSLVGVATSRRMVV